MMLLQHGLLTPVGVDPPVGVTYCDFANIVAHSSSVSSAPSVPQEKFSQANLNLFMLVKSSLLYSLHSMICNASPSLYIFILLTIWSQHVFVVDTEAK